MDTRTLIILAVVAALLVLAALILFGRRQRVTLAGDEARPLEKRSFAPPAVEAAALAAVAAPVDPVAADAILAPPDPLTTIKGLGPRAAARLDELGVTRFAQLAALDEAGAAALDARMGNFRGRLARDRWVEQAALLAAGDTAGFEERFGRIG